MLMKKRFSQVLLLLIALMALPVTVWADREVNQLQFGKQTITVASDEVITFYDFKGADDIPSSSQSNSQSLTVFTPAESGKSIQITFEEIDIIPDMSSGSYPAYMKVYSGTPSDDGFTWATQATDVKKDSPLPDGNVLVTRGGMTNSEAYTSTTSETYISEAADGSMAVGFIYVYAKKCKGWKATVRAVQLENMTVTGAGSNYNGVVASPTSKQNVALANAYVTAEGVMNPDHVTGIWFAMTQNESVVDPTALKLFKGDTPVEAAVSADGNGYLFTLNEALADGTTTFTIKGDILGTAAVGAKVEVAVTKVATTALPDGITPFTAGTSVVVENPAIVIMTATPQTVTVGETPLQFYDEGGIDGSIPGTASGQVTFLSGVEGKKVMVDFSSITINNGSLYYQSIEVYNGQSTNAADLLKIFRSGESGLIRSTADDGSLTVVLKAASQTTPLAGWEAQVSLFIPQPMDFDDLTTVAASTETVCAGDADQDMLTINVKAVNTEPAMQVTKMVFNAGENYAKATAAALYFGTTKVGEAAIEAASFEITLTAPQVLVEGDNVFTLKYTISDEVLNGDKVSAQLVSVTALVNSSEKTESASSSAVERTVKNIVLNHADQGTVIKTVNGSLAFETKPKNEYSTTYETGTDDRINIFIPKHEGMVCQIDFESFKIYYYSYNVSSSAKFKIYNGQGTSGEVLWEPSTQSDYSNGPGRIVRSTAADGSLTVVFNPNQSYSTNDGWKATVSEYESKDMAVTAVEATQASTADASIGASDQELLNVNVKTEGNLNPLSMSALTLNLKGTEASISNVSVWQGETKLGEASAAAEVSVTFSEALTLAEGDNTFVVKVDIKSDAEENSTIDAKVVSITAGSAVEATNGDPDGARTLKNQILLTAGDHGTISLGLGAMTTIYDDGGPDGDGADGVEATITIAPTGEAESIKLTDKGINFSYTSYVYIYEGSEVNDDKLLLTLNGSSAKFDPIIVDGPVTIKYIGKGSYTKPNIAIQAEGYKKSDVVITGITTEDISVNEVLKGQTDVKMLKVMVEAKGELTPAEITAFDIAGADGEAVEATHIYQTGTTTTFSANEDFNGTYSITNSGTYYFWLTYDVKTTATEGQTASATLNAITVNGETVAVTEPVTATITVASGMSGTKIVGTGGDYATIQGAVDAIAALGMEGPVTLKIKAGEYNEKVRVPYIMGMGAVNTLTIESESGQRDVKIYHNNYTTAGYSADQHKKDYGVVTLYQANYVTLKNLEITTTDKAYKAVVMIKDESRHATIDNCYLHAPICTASSGEDAVLIGHTIIDEENKNNDYLTVKNCLLEGGKMGVSMGGTSYVRLPKEVGGIIEGNTFKNNGTKAIYVMDELGVKIKNNTVIIEASAETKISNGVLDIQLRDEYSEATEITGNVFNIAPKSYCAAMYLRQLTSTAEQPMIIANNVINMTSLNASYNGIYVGNANTVNLMIANNTIRLTGSNSAAALRFQGNLSEDAPNIVVVNNIIQNEANNFATYLNSEANAAKLTFQNNLMYSNGTNFASIGGAKTFDEFVTATGATNCVNKQVTFASNDILMPDDDLDGDLLTAQALDYVTTDVTGKARPATGISIGAYEYDATDAVPVMAEGYPTVSVSGTETSMDATISIKANAMGRAFLIVKEQGGAAPTVDEVVASTTKTTIQADTEASLSWSNLQESTTYVAYIVLQSIGGTSGELTTKEFATSEQPVELMAVCTDPVTTIDSGSEAVLKVMVASGKAPFTISWMDQKHNTVGESFESTLLGEDITMTIVPDRSADYIVTVTDAQNKVDTDTCRIVLKGEAMVADFEYLYLQNDSYWAGPDWKGTQEESLYGPIEFQGSFVSGSYKFANNNIPDYPSWNAFAYANKQANTYYDLMEDMCNSTVGGAYKGDNYAVFFDPTGFAPATVTVLNNPDGQVIPGFYITNAAYTVNAILYGDGNFNHGETDGQGNTIYDNQGNVVGQEEFHQGDFLLLTITADNDEEVKFYLADYRSENEDDWYYIQDWQYVDLTSLGTVKELEFALTSSRTNSWGYTTPLYCCIDDFGAPAPVAVTVSDLGYATFSWPHDLDFTNSGVQAFIATDVTDMVMLQEVKTVPAGTGVVLKGAAGTYYPETIDHATDNVTGNRLIGTATAPYTVQGNNTYVLSKYSDGTPGFRLAAEGLEIPQYKAYITLDNGQARPFFAFANDAVTGIDTMTVATDDKEVYDLSGRRVQKPARGLYIKDGKKVVIK